MKKAEPSGETSSRTVREIWPWIPAFKAVAETEHLPTAASQLHITASALSRTVRLLEDAVGQPLFLRTARRMLLNAAGKRVLAAVQRATTALEVSIPSALGAGHVGDFRVSSLGVLTDFVVMPALLEFAASHDGMVPCLSTLRSREANRQIATGQLEVAFYYDATAQSGVRCEHIGSVRSSVHCGSAHPLFGRSRVSRATLLEHPFSAPGMGDRGTRMDGWPVDVPRRIGFEITMLSTNIAVALSGRYLTVLPDLVARPHIAAGHLWRLPGMTIADVDVYAATLEASASAVTADLVATIAARLAKEHEV